MVFNDNNDNVYVVVLVVVIIIVVVCLPIICPELLQDVVHPDKPMYCNGLACDLMWCGVM